MRLPGGGRILSQRHVRLSYARNRGRLVHWHSGTMLDVEVVAGRFAKSSGSQRDQTLALFMVAEPPTGYRSAAGSKDRW